MILKKPVSRGNDASASLRCSEELAVPELHRLQKDDTTELQSCDYACPSGLMLRFTNAKKSSSSDR